MEPGFKLEGNAIDADALQEELQRRVEERRRAGAYTHEVESSLAERLPDEPDGATLPPAAALDYAATRAGSSWEVTAAYPVATDRRVLRPFIIFAKRLARLWARIAVGPIQREQTAYNRHVASALEALRRQALDERAGILAAEEDLSLLAEALSGGTAPGELVEAVLTAFGDTGDVTILGPCDPALAGRLAAGRNVVRVSPPTPWDEPGPGGGVASGPVTFISQVPESSLGSILVCDLAFWLRPEALVDLARRSYLALADGGRLAVAVRELSGDPAPAWSTPPVIGKALELAGFAVHEPVASTGDSPRWFVSVGLKG